MTLWAERDGSVIRIHGNINLDVTVRNGQVSEFSVAEDVNHVRHFAGQLLGMVNQAEKVEAAEEFVDAIAEEELAEAAEADGFDDYDDRDESG